VAVVARRHGVNANLLFTWRRRFVAAGSARPRETMSIVPMAIAAEDSPAILLPSSGNLDYNEINGL
jgi:transposase